ncbi:hypothetical protein [Chloroflexus sp.]|uniref:hypothetical protein n=1 Tax=Chloroflexus sp. TaxID=1904827 RepID=UPI002ACEB7D2|nr:hypothetical protein [Chloroflexus sp.]
MEHSLQVFCTLLIAHGFIEYARYQQLSRWMPVALILAPLVRYENLAISLLAAIFLITKGKRWLGLATIVCIDLLVGGSLLFLMSLGLSPLPASIIVKSTALLESIDIDVPSPMLNIVISLFTRPGTVVFFLLLFMVTGIFLSIIESSRKPLALISVLATIAHVMFGKYGAYGQIYISVFILIMMLYLFQPIIIHLFQTYRSSSAIVILTVWMAFLGSGHIKTFLSTPLAAANIYQQQYQMHRFVTEYYQQPVAVNNIGYVSHHNKRYVLDLWGLSSDETLRRDYNQPDWLATIIRDHDINMVYEKEFAIPKNWIKLGELQLGVPLVSAADSRVSLLCRTRIGD